MATQVADRCQQTYQNAQTIGLKSLDNSVDTDILYFDHRKAFDGVVHTKLIHKLWYQYQQNEINVNWVQNVLNKQQVKVGKSLSEPAEVISGVAQGTLLGPVLFIMYTNDLTEIIQHSSVTLYVDDTKLYKIIRDNLDSDLMQIDAENITTWSIRWQLPLNPLKMVLLQVPSNNDRSYVVLGSEIMHKHSNNDLGIIIQDNLSFKEHCISVARNSTFVIRNMKNVFYQLQSLLLYFLYLKLIFDHSQKLIQLFSRHKLLNALTFQKDCSVALQCTCPDSGTCPMRTGLNFQELNLLRSDVYFLISCFYIKLLLGTPTLIQIFLNLTQIQQEVIHLKLKVVAPKKDVRKYIWLNRVISIWNILPSDIIDQRSNFRIKLEKVDLSPYCVGSAFHCPQFQLLGDIKYKYKLSGKLSCSQVVSGQRYCYLL